MVSCFVSFFPDSPKMESSGFSRFSKSSWGSGYSDSFSPDSTSSPGSKFSDGFASSTSFQDIRDDTPFSSFSDFTSGSSFNFSDVNKQLGKSSSASTTFDDSSTTSDSFLESSTPSSTSTSDRGYRMYLPMYDYQVDERSGVYQRKRPKRVSTEAKPVERDVKNVAEVTRPTPRKPEREPRLNVEHRGAQPGPDEAIIAKCEHYGKPEDTHECEVSKVIYVYIRGQKGDPGVGIQGNPGRDGKDGKDGKIGHKGVPGNSVACPLSHYYLSGDSARGRKYSDELRELSPITSKANAGSHVKLYPGHYGSLNVVPGVTYSARGKVVVDNIDTKSTINSNSPAYVEGVTFNKADVGGNIHFNRCTFNDTTRLIDEENVGFNQCSLKGVEIHDPVSRNSSSRIRITNNEFDSKYIPINAYGGDKPTNRHITIKDNKLNLRGPKDKTLVGSRFDGMMDDVHMTGNVFSVPDGTKSLVISEFDNKTNGRLISNAVAGDVPDNLVWVNNLGKGRVESYNNYPKTTSKVRVIRESARLNNGDKYVFVESPTPVSITLPASEANHSVNIKSKYGGVDHRIHPMEGETIETGLNAYPLVGTDPIKFRPHAGSWYIM